MVTPDPEGSGYSNVESMINSGRRYWDRGILGNREYEGLRQHSQDSQAHYGQKGHTYADTD